MSKIIKKCPNDEYDRNRCRVCGVPWDGTEGSRKSDPPLPHEGGHSELSPKCAGRPPAGH